MEKKNIKSALSLAIRAALAAGRDIMEIYTDPNQDFGIERKADNSPLTLADKAAHRRIATMLQETGLPILSEEGRHDDYATRSQWVAFWMVDPLDGTKEFIKRNGEFTVNIALVLDKHPHVGVVYAPARRVLYFGDPLLGAYKVEDIEEWNEAERLPDLLERAQRLPLERPKDRPYTIVASRSHMSAETEQYINEARKEHGQVELLSCGSSLKLCAVAEGMADAYPRYAPTMEWDTAAGHAVVACAGKWVMQAGTDEPLEYNKEDLHNPWFLVI
jgi:3'(2'), 5'-bisphosphate nucleotidase